MRARVSARAPRDHTRTSKAVGPCMNLCPLPRTRWCAHDYAHRYGEHQGWLEEVENRRKTARSRPATARPGSSARKDERPVLKPQRPTKWHEECVEMVGECRNCVTQALKAI